MENTFLDKIKNSTIQDHIVDVRSYAGEMTIVVHAKDIVSVCKTMKEKFGFTYLADISTVDHYTDEQRFEIAYNIVNMADRQRLRISTFVEEDDPRLDSVIEVWGAANWFEREAWDMMGIKFNNHPDLRRIFLPEDFQYHPMRKEFPQLGIPGSIELPEKDPPKEYK
jgi:NADH-quinone oxidoreductase subunit C